MRMTTLRLLKKLAAWQHKSSDIKMNCLPTISITCLNLEPCRAPAELKSLGILIVKTDNIQLFGVKKRKGSFKLIFALSLRLLN